MRSHSVSVRTIPPQIVVSYSLGEAKARDSGSLLSGNLPRAVVADEGQQQRPAANQTPHDEEGQFGVEPYQDHIHWDSNQDSSEQAPK